jgi:hypothetical protein
MARILILTTFDLVLRVDHPQRVIAFRATTGGPVRRRRRPGPAGDDRGMTI